VTAQLAELAVDLRAMWVRQRRVGACEPVEHSDLEVELLLSFRGQRIDEIVDGLDAVAVPVVHRLHWLTLES
jgi:hypothetical protein